MNWRHYISTKAWGYNLLALIAFLLPLTKKFVPPAIALALVGSMWMMFRHRGKLAKHEGYRILPVLLMALLYALLLVGYLFTGDPVRASRELEYKLSFLVFPLLFFLIPSLSGKHFRALVDVFAFSCLLFIAVALIRGFVLLATEGTWMYFSYERLGRIFHPSYMSAYQGLALFHLLIRGAQRDYLLGRRIFHFVVEALVVLFIVLLASKAGLIVTAVLLIVHPAVHRHWYVQRRAALLRSGVLLVWLIGLAWAVPATQKRIGSMQNTEVATENPELSDQPKSSTSLRLVVWKASWALIKAHPAGLGTGNVQSALNATYEAVGEDYAARRNLNAHSQFLQVALEFGWAGLLVFVFFLIAFLYASFRTRNWWALAIAGMVAFHCMVESFLEVQAGIVFTCFWIVASMKSEAFQSWKNQSS